MPDHYGDHRDTQHRWMHRPAPHLPEGYESRLFRSGEVHRVEEGWTHYPHDAIERGNPSSKITQLENELLKGPAEDAHARIARLEKELAAAKAALSVHQPAEAAKEDFGAQLASMRRPALLKLASDLGLQFDTSATVETLRGLIFEAHHTAE